MEYNYLMQTLFILILSSVLSAAVIKHETTSPHLMEFDYAVVCEKMGSKDAVLITPTSLTELECLNKKYTLVDFCLKEFPMDKKLTRGFIDKAKKKVICEFSESVMISVSCDQRDLKYCFEPKKGCDDLRKLYANRLEVAHYSMLEKNLNCYYAKALGESLE